MLSKALLVVKSKAALAILGVALVGGGGTVAAVAATQGHVSLPGMQQSAKTPDADATKTGDNHAHTVAIEGVLKAYDATAKTISVQTKDVATPTTVSVDATTRINGDKVSALADLTKNIGHKVEVQADKQADGTLLAWKITVQGVDNSNGQDNSHGSDNGQGDNQHPLSGTISAVNVAAGTFTLKLPDGTTKTISVSTQTRFDGSMHGLANLKANMHVTVKGTAQPDGTIAATSIEAGA
jgi:hypothetical protein